jgi:hypothetical protein
MYEGFGRDPAHAAGATGRSPFQKVRRQRRNILTPLAQRRQFERDHIQAVIQILAKRAAPDLGRQIAVGGCEEPQRAKAIHLQFVDIARIIKRLSDPKPTAQG